MATGMKHLHSTLAYVLFAGLIIAFLYVLIAAIRNKPYNRKMALLGLITAHLQLVVGLVTYFVSPYGVQRFGEFGGVMKDKIGRLYLLEHPLMMIIAIILITIGYSRAKKMESSNKQNKTVAIFYGIALVLIIAMIPWHAWPSWFN